MSERKTEEEKINEKRSFLQKILGFRFTPSISAWKLAIALFLLIAIAYAVNGAGIIAKGDNLEVSGNATVQGKLEVSGNATVQGKIGIGTTIPARKLHIKDSAADNVLVVDSGDGITQRFSSVDLHDNGAAKWGIGKNPSGDFYIDQSSVGNTITILGSDRNVGIGTTSPATKLHIVDDQGVTSQHATAGGQGGFLIRNSAGTQVGEFKYASPTLLINAPVAGDDIQLATQGGNRVFIRDDGNVGIGTTNPAQKLDVAGQIHATGDICTDVNGKCLSTAGGGVGGGGGWTEDAAGNKIYTTNTGRNVGIGTTSPQAKLHIGGTAGTDGIMFPDGSVLTSASGIGGGGVPTGTIAFFDGPCPAGWTEYTTLQGRVIIGVPASGTVGGTVGSPLSNLGQRILNQVPGHLHMMRITGTNPHGQAANGPNSYEPEAGAQPLFATVGVSDYSDPPPSMGITTGYTGQPSGVDVTMPYIQLTACQCTGPSCSSGGGASGGWTDAGTNVYLTTDTDNVGIGTTSPSQPLEVAGITSPAIAIQEVAKEWRMAVESSKFKIIETGVADRLAIDTSGNVGIGTTTPEENLHVYGSGIQEIKLSSTDDDSRLHIHSITTQPALMTLTSGTDNSVDSFTISVGATNKDLQFIPAQDPADTASMTILQSGNVGIGTTAPAVPLEVWHNSAATSGTTDVMRIMRSTSAPLASVAAGFGPRLTFQANTATGGSGFAAIESTIETAGSLQHGNLRFYTVRDAGFQERMRINSNGNVGIGTTNPNSDGRGKLEVKGILGENAGMAVTDGTTRWGWRLDGTNRLQWLLNGADKGHLTSAGVWTDASDVSIKKDITDLGYGLDELLQLQPRFYRMKDSNMEQIGFIAQEVEQVIPEVVSGEEGRKGLAYGHLTALTVQAIKELDQRTQGLETTAEGNVIINQGNVGIGTTNPGYKLDVAGEAHASSFPTSSDIRFKKNVQQLSSVLDKLQNVRGVSFDWNEKYIGLGRATDGRQIGVIAQELEQQFPELVSTWGNESYRAVDYGRLTAVLLEAVKELKAENNDLKQRIGRLEENLIQ